MNEEHESRQIAKLMDEGLKKGIPLLEMKEMVDEAISTADMTLSDPVKLLREMLDAHAG